MLSVGLGLAWLRGWALLSVQVLWRQSVGPVWVVVSGGLALPLALAMGPRAEPSVDPWLAAAAELVLGGLLGMLAALPGHALRGASGATARVLGTATAPWRALTMALVAATALSLGLHRPLVQGVQALAEPWPVGAPHRWVVAWSAVEVARVAHAMTLVALTLATPALLAGAVAELATRLLGRGPPVGLAVAEGAARWLRVAAALVATGASWAAYDAIWAERALGLW